MFITDSKSSMQAVIGSYPHTDGNFDRNNNFSTTIVDGSVAVPIDTINGFAGNVVYVIPASKSESCPSSPSNAPVHLCKRPSVYFHCLHAANALLQVVLEILASDALYQGCNTFNSTPKFA